MLARNSADPMGGGSDSRELDFTAQSRRTEAQMIEDSTFIPEISVQPRRSTDHSRVRSPALVQEPPDILPQSFIRGYDLLMQSAGSDTTQMEEFPAPIKPKLLPDNMSFMERGLWGESGILRGIGIASPLTPEVRKHELALRRTMLTMHQIGGFLTLGSMITAVYFGQKSLNDPNTGQKNDPYRSSHQTFVVSTIALYSATGLLSVLSPPPLIRRDETSTTTIHKTLAWVHFAGMVITPILGNAIFKRDQFGRYADVNRARYHQISAYITTAVFAASMIIITF
jgi:hypothetical protein